MEQQKRPRGPSGANKAAERYYVKHPEATAMDLAKRFEIDLTTVYRSAYWKAAHPKAAEQGGEG